eukprot:2664853-Pleurochrysis_carterae.AAC.1
MRRRVSSFSQIAFFYDGATLEAALARAATRRACLTNTASAAPLIGSPEARAYVARNLVSF